MMRKIRLVAALSCSLLAACQAPVSSLSDVDLRQSAERGNGEAQYRLAKQLASRSHYVEAMQWMQKAAALTDVSAASSDTRAAAALQVGDWYQAGLGEPKNTPLARQWWQKASRLGSGEAGYRLGTDCQAQHQGKLVAACLDAFERAADNQYAPAQLVVAQWYTAHPGAEKEATGWIEKAADLGDRDAQYQLAQRYEQGKGVAKRTDLAERWYFRAADRGQPQAQLWMAKHAEGKDALDWYQKAAANGEADAQLWLAQAYRDGNKGLVKNDKQAHYWLDRASGKGNGEADYKLSQMQSDATKREYYLVLASAAGYVPAARELGNWLLKRGELERAREVFAKAAATGDTESRLAYGEILRLGQGGKADYVEAMKQYRFAAHDGNRMAQYRMGMMRQDGLGASRNRIHAYAWYSLAATEGMAEALAARNDLEATMQPDEIKAAQKLAMHWSSGKETDTQ
ncbi:MULTISPECIES: tetratricopeptide repeat protein [Dickeya]|uniref:tetratricopeptide repeat protein n=1 Tax=Dickeya TaxID=204037 RepID=UPI00316864CD